MTEIQALIVQAINSALGQKLIIRNCKGNFIIAKPPTISANMVGTNAQNETRTRFSDAIAYARQALANPSLAKMYKKKATQKRSAFNLACRDFMKPPEVQRIDVDNYNGKAGTTITVKAKDDFEINGVEIRIFDVEGELLDQGFAKKDIVYNIRWVYTSQKDLVKIRSFKVQAIAWDHAGNTGELEITM